MTDLISRADAICEVLVNDGIDNIVDRINKLPSADAESDDLIIKGAKGIQDGLYNIKDGKLFKYKAKGGTVRVYSIVPSAETHGKRTETHGVCSGLISRADAIDAIMSEPMNGPKYPIWFADKIKALPSAETVHGEWKIDEYGIYHCPFCHAINNTVYKSFCPNCGARMKGGDDE